MALNLYVIYEISRLKRHCQNDVVFMTSETHRLMRLLHCSVFKERTSNPWRPRASRPTTLDAKCPTMIRVRPTDPCRSRHDGYHIAAYRACQGKRWYGFLTAPQIGIPGSETQPLAGRLQRSSGAHKIFTSTGERLLA